MLVGWKTGAGLMCAAGRWPHSYRPERQPQGRAKVVSINSPHLNPEKQMVTEMGLALAMLVLACINAAGLTLVWLELRTISRQLGHGLGHGG